MLFHVLSFALLAAGPTLAASPSLSKVPACADLEEPVLGRVLGLMERRYVYDACDRTVLACIQADQPVSTALRLASEICRRVKDGQDDASVHTALDLRERSMMPAGPPLAISAEDMPVFGAPDAPVTLVEYGSIRCAECLRLTLAIRKEILAGRLQGRVRLVFKPIPSSEPGATEADLAALATRSLGRFWEFLELAAANFGTYSVEGLPTWVEQGGMNPAEYRKILEDPAIRATLDATVQEADANGILGTPAFFISGRLYQGPQELAPLVDMLLEEAERLAAR